MPKLLTEFVGTFFLVFVVLLAGPGGTAGNFAPIAIGLTLMVMVYMGGHVSGAHYNPAVTLAVLVRGKISVAEAGAYWGAQFIAGLFAALAALFVLGKSGAAAPAAGTTLVQVYLIEILFTFALALVVLNVATAKGTANNSFYGAAIGMTVCAGAFAGGGISGGAFNPAVGCSPIVFEAIHGMTKGLANIPLYLIGPGIGGALAGGVVKLQHPGE